MFQFWNVGAQAELIAVSPDRSDDIDHTGRPRNLFRRLSYLEGLKLFATRQRDGRISSA